MPQPLDAAAKRRKARDGYLRRNYGVGIEWYEAKLEDQGGRCAICLCRPRTRVLAVDHDHFTGKLRGLLCGRCNHGLLQFAQEDITILKRAIEYLLSHLEGTKGGSDSVDKAEHRPSIGSDESSWTASEDAFGPTSLGLSGT